jgi:Secretion system C-terminal sorting domain
VIHPVTAVKFFAMIKQFYPLLLLFPLVSLSAQSKRDNQWIIGYDQMVIAEVMNINFSTCLPIVALKPTPNTFGMEGSNTSLCDEAGNLLFYSNGCFIVNAAGAVMDNGAGINPGYIEKLYCPVGGSPYVQGVIALPGPGSDSLCYVFNLDMSRPYTTADTFLDVAPERVYYQVIDMSQSGGLGKVIRKNQIAVFDTLARGGLKAVRHANGKDWWIIVPKSNSNCYFITLLTDEGVQKPQLKCVGKPWNDVSSSAQTVFSPNGRKYMRCNKSNGLHIYDFDTETGDLFNPVFIDFPTDTFAHGGLAVSANSRLLYVSARRKLLQFDLFAQDIAATKKVVSQWDGVTPLVFYNSALAPDNKIYISAIASHKFLHIVHAPDSIGVACRVQQRGLTLPAFNFATIPNLPHYRTQANTCDTTAVSVKDNISALYRVSLFPNPVTQEAFITTNSVQTVRDWHLTDVTGRTVHNGQPDATTDPLRLDVSTLPTGMYWVRLRFRDGGVAGAKLVKY